MHCECCDSLLSNHEGRIKLSLSGQYANTCLSCLKTMDVEYALPKDEFDEDINPVYKELEAQADKWLADNDEDAWDEQ